MTIWGLHGVKRRWVERTVADGLRHDSAAWFLTPLRPGDPGLDATVAAAVYLALAPATRARLVADPGRGRYGEIFEREPGLLPDLVFFRDRPTGREALHRYVWLRSPAPSPTAPYTKVARAGREVSLRDADMWIHRGDARQLAAIEQQVDRTPGADSWWRDPGLLRRVGPEDPVSQTPDALHHTKIGSVCWAIARAVRAAAVIQAGGH
jgi:hypothetical protein